MVVPASIRARAGLTPGAELEIALEDDLSVKVTRVAAGPKLVKVKGRLVARPTVPAEDLPALDVAQLVDDERERWPL
jgi:hypothetical protein